MQASQYSKDGKSPPSILSFILPSDWFSPNPQNNDVKSAGSDSFTWRSKSFSLKDKPLDIYTECDNEYETKEIIKSHEENGELGPNHNHESFGTRSDNVKEPGSGTSTSSSFDLFEDFATPHAYEKSMPNLTEESVFISPDLYQFFEASLPNIVKGCQWVLLYR